MSINQNQIPTKRSSEVMLGFTSLKFERDKLWFMNSVTIIAIQTAYCLDSIQNDESLSRQFLSPHVPHSLFQYRIFTFFISFLERSDIFLRIATLGSCHAVEQYPSKQKLLSSIVFFRCLESLLLYFILEIKCLNQSNAMIQRNKWEQVWGKH